MFVELTQAVNAIKELVDLFKSAKELLPSGADRSKIEQAINEAERKLAMAEAEVAKKLEYDLCQCTFPPQIMLFKAKDNKTECPACGHCISKKLDIDWAPSHNDMGY